MQSWRKELRTWANECASGFVNRNGILGVVMGGSLARGQEWRHSDLEIGVLVEEKDPQLSYFNIHAGRGVEIIQLGRRELEEQIGLVEAGDWSPLHKWPIQLWKGRIIHDPSGVMERFKRQFDGGLFRQEVVAERIADLQIRIGKALGEGRDLLAVDRPAAALVKTRSAMNDAILAFHWAHGELPRSQNRTDSRLRQLCRKHSAASFYNLYRDVFDLNGANRIIKATWPSIREQVLDITRLWGDEARDFFCYAVDSHFAWRQNAGILTVYRLYIPVIGGDERGLMGKLDDPNWKNDHKLLAAFLGLNNAEKDKVAGLVERIWGAI